VGGANRDTIPAYGNTLTVSVELAYHRVRRSKCPFGLMSISWIQQSVGLTLVIAVGLLSFPLASVVAQQADLDSSDPVASAAFSWTDTYGQSPANFSPGGWGAIIDAQWGVGLPTATKLQIFDQWWEEIDLRFGMFHNLEFDIFAFRDQYRPEIAAGVSRGRFAAIMSHFGYRLKDLHTYIYDIPVRFTTLNKGTPLLVIGQWGTNRHFGALLTPLPDSTLLVYRTVPNHPIGLEPGDLVLGYDGVSWKDIYPQLLEAELPLALNSVNARTDEANDYYLLQAAGLNWHLFDTIDIVKYSTGETQHFPTSMLAGQTQNLWGSEQLDVSGVTWPPRLTDRVSWGVVDNTNIGYVYVTSWTFDPLYNIREEFFNAIDSLMHHTTTDGIILDFRYNTGGGALAREGLELLFNEVTTTVGFKARCSTPDHFCLIEDPLRNWQNLVIQADPTTFYDKPIAVLIGPGAISAGELEAIRTDFHPNARLFGRAASGGNSGSDFITLHSDWFASRASGPVYYRDTGELLSHIALQPDEEVWFTQEDVANGIDTVSKAAMDWISSTTAIEDEPTESISMPLHVRAHPNPFRTSTTLAFDLPSPSHVHVALYNSLGQRVAVLMDEQRAVGKVQITFDANDPSYSRMASGAYFYRVETASAAATGKIVHLR